MSDVLIRPARYDERSFLEALQWRASLANSGDRDSLLANPDAIAVPAEQITDGHVLVAQSDGVIVDSCADLARRRASRILHVVGNPHAEGFYVACAFRTTGAVETRFGGGLAMQRAL
jgi:hypothetical protein